MLSVSLLCAAALALLGASSPLTVATHTPLAAANDTSADYLFLAHNDPKPVERRQTIAFRKAGFVYGDMKAAGATTFVTGYAINVTVPIANPLNPTSPIGTYLQQQSVAQLTVDVLLTSAKYAPSAAAALKMPPPVTLEDYTHFYNVYEHLPAGLKTPGAWRTDEFFGELFLGYFPTTTNRTFAPTLDRLGSLVSANQLKKWQKWSDNGRLFHINHTDVLHRSNLDSLDRRVTICPSLVLFHNERIDGKWTLTPIGILINNEWITPADGDRWLAAKLAALQVEALNLPMDHFLKTHVLVSPFAMAIFANMGFNHPFANFIANIFDYDWGLIVRGGTGLFIPGTSYDKITATGAIGMHTFLNAQWPAFKWSDHFIENELARRGVLDMKGFLFGKFMMMYRDAWYKFFYARVCKYWPTDADVANDQELQDVWVDASTRGKLYGLPVLDSRVALALALTHFQMTVARHGATNYFAYGEVQQVLPYAVPHLNCSWPETNSVGIVTEAWIVQTCMPNVTISVATIQNAVAFSRTFAVSYMTRHLPETILVGTDSKKERDELAKDFDKIDAAIMASVGTTIVPYDVLLSTRLPRAGAV